MKRLVKISTRAHVSLDLHEYLFNYSIRRLVQHTHSHESWEQRESSVLLTEPHFNLLLLRVHSFAAKPVLLPGFIKLAVSILLVIRMLK